jgi:hypothetical protein
MTNFIETIADQTVVQNDISDIATTLDPKMGKPMLQQTLQDLETERVGWEKGAYRTSNLQLYGLLSKCLAYCGPVDDIKQAKARNAALESFCNARGYNCNPNSPLATRVVGAVFGKVDRRRICTYSLVLREAMKQSKLPHELASWIEALGGIEAIRLSQAPGFIATKTKVELAKKAAEEQPGLGIVQNEAIQQIANSEHMGNDCVLLAEQQADGSFRIKALLRTKGVVNAAYAALYSQQKESIVAKTLEVEAANDTYAKEQAIADAVNTAKLAA